MACIRCPDKSLGIPVEGPSSTHVAEAGQVQQHAGRGKCIHPLATFPCPDISSLIHEEQLVNASALKESAEATRQGSNIGILTRMTVVRPPYVGYMLAFCLLKLTRCTSIALPSFVPGHGKCFTSALCVPQKVAANLLCGCQGSF